MYSVVNLLLCFVFNRATAYFGQLEVCKPKAGETLVVNAAAGASCWLCFRTDKEIKGMRVASFAGSDEKKGGELEV